MMMISKQLLLGACIASTALAVPPNNLRRNGITYDNIDPSATQGAQALLRFLQGQYGSHYLSGQQELSEVEWIKQNIGVTPAILGNDFMDYSPSRVEHGTSPSQVENAMTFDSMGGINAWLWHWNAPTCLYDTEEEPWYSGFYTAATCFDVQGALNEGPGGSNYDLLLRDIDAIAEQIKRLSDANIPFLWRPLHEPDGAWFWWGAKGAAPFLQLWDLVYDRITNYHGLHNMVWVCNTMNPDWYPGNDKCDIVTTDIYADVGDHSPQQSSWDTLYGLCNGERIIALAEVGEIPDPEQQASDGVPWAYWTTWVGDFIEDGNYNPISFLQNVYSHPNVGTLDGVNPIGDWKSS